MKRLEKIRLRTVTDRLSDAEMKDVKGGVVGSPKAFGGKCCCGMGSSSACFKVTAPSMDDALLVLSNVCPGGIGGCFA